MKKLVIFFCIVLFQFSCSKKSGTTDATVHHHCTGSYLKINDKEFFVCNYKKLNGTKDGEIVKVIFETAAECTGEDKRIRCMMLYSHDGFIKIKHIEKSGSDLW